MSSAGPSLWHRAYRIARATSFGSPAAIEDQRRAGHQRGGVGGEKQARAGQLVELAEAAELDLGQYLVAERLILEERTRHRRLEKGRSQAVDADIVGRELDRHGFGES